MHKVLSFAMLFVLCAASIAARGEDAVATLGKQRAARAAVEWNVREVTHPQLGPIKFAAQKNAIVTAVRSERILTLAHVSCQKASGKIAIELSNAFESDPAGGLRPLEMPQLVCNRPAPEGGAIMVKTGVAAAWEIGNLGDTLARGLSPSDLRECAWIDIVQNLALPAGGTSQGQRIAMEIQPYGRELDSVFVACGEATAFGGAEPAQATTPKAAPAAPAEAAWKRAHTIRGGRTNIRSAPDVDSAVVVQLAPGASVLVQRVSAQWWKVKPRSGQAFSGYVRQSRLVFE